MRAIKARSDKLEDCAKKQNEYQERKLSKYILGIERVFLIQSDPDLPDPDLPEPRFTGWKNFPRIRKLTVYHPDIPGTPIYRAKPFPPSNPVNRGPTVI
eukprot:sb/3478673/